MKFKIYVSIVESHRQLSILVTDMNLELNSCAQAKIPTGVAQSWSLIEIHFLPLRGSIFKLCIASPGAGKSQMLSHISVHLDSLVTSAIKQFAAKSVGFLLFFCLKCPFLRHKSSIIWIFCFSFPLLNIILPHHVPLNPGLPGKMTWFLMHSTLCLSYSLQNVLSLSFFCIQCREGFLSFGWNPEELFKVVIYTSLSFFLLAIAQQKTSFSCKYQIVGITF